jgi:hypothetical protein
MARFHFRVNCGGAASRDGRYKIQDKVKNARLKKQATAANSKQAQKKDSKTIQQPRAWGGRPRQEFNIR